MKRVIDFSKSLRPIQKSRKLNFQINSRRNRITVVALNRNSPNANAMRLAQIDSLTLRGLNRRDFLRAITHTLSPFYVTVNEE